MANSGRGVYIGGFVVCMAHTHPTNLLIPMSALFSAVTPRDVQSTQDIVGYVCYKKQQPKVRELVDDYVKNRPERIVGKSEKKIELTQADSDLFTECLIQQQVVVNERSDKVRELAELSNSLKFENAKLKEFLLAYENDLCQLDGIAEENQQLKKRLEMITLERNELSYFYRHKIDKVKRVRKLLSMPKKPLFARTIKKQ